ILLRIRRQPAHIPTLDHTRPTTRQPRSFGSITEAQLAQSALGEVSTVPEQRWYDARLLEDIVSHADKKASELASEFDQELNAKRTAYISGMD
ncbi:hypothetical protein ACFY04_12230, partial [Streptomyces sp. NPDC001549]|uniref:hypothetical protein n=1 Tax=Streptomyces sp. NPDC001549 TaxID=3364586 RepID=UPI0036850532